MYDLSDLSINGIPCPMAFVPPGGLTLGTGDKAVKIEFEKGYYMAKYPLTQGLWQSVMGDNPSVFKNDNHPVENVSWEDICKTEGFLDQLNSCKEARTLQEKDGMRFLLPSETMWEYAAQGGDNSLGFRYAGSNKLKEVGWYSLNSHGETKPVGLKLPNELGLYDMSGNVWEWCADHWHNNYEGAPTDGSAWVTGDDSAVRVVRGGSWFLNQYYCRSSNRGRFETDIRYNNIGFRLARY